MGVVPAKVGIFGSAPLSRSKCMTARSADNAARRNAVCPVKSTQEISLMGITGVIGAANRGSDDILELLVKKGASLDVKDKQGRTPLVWAKGVFLATNPPVEKPSTMALIGKLTAR